MIVEDAGVRPVGAAVPIQAEQPQDMPQCSDGGFASVILIVPIALLASIFIVARFDLHWAWGVPIYGMLGAVFVLGMALLRASRASDPQR